jgi:peroxiredoxin
MNPIRIALLAAVTVFLAAPLLSAKDQPTEYTINKQFEKLRALPIEQRPPTTNKIAADIRTLSADSRKVELADKLAHAVTEGDQGAEALQAVADTLSQALAQSPVPAKGDKPPAAYLDLAGLVRYEGVKATLNDPLFTKARQTLIDDDAELEKADFTLKDMHGNKVTLSELRGKIVLINFWATTCVSCHRELPALDLIYTNFQSQGLVVLSITDETAFKVNAFIAPTGYHPPVLLDPNSKVHALFHVTGAPRTFVFNRQGKLVAEAIDQRSQRQFLAMLSGTGLHN